MRLPQHQLLVCLFLSHPAERVNLSIGQIFAASFLRDFNSSKCVQSSQAGTVKLIIVLLTSQMNYCIDDILVLNWT